MLTEWIYWVRTLSTGGLLEVIAVLMLIDLPRYGVHSRMEGMDTSNSLP